MPRINTDSARWCPATINECPWLWLMTWRKRLRVQWVSYSGLADLSYRRTNLAGQNTRTD